MATEEEEIRQELADEGITDTATPMAPVAEPEEQVVESDVIDASGDPPEPEQPETPEPAPVVVEDPRDAAIRELRQELLGQRSKLADMERGGFRHAPLVTDLDEEILRRDPNTFQQVSELNEYYDAKFRMTQRQMEMRSQVAGRISASEQHARGLLSAESVGEGYDYDTLTAKHVSALEAENPVIAELLQRLPGDPAMNRYTLALVREIQTLAGKEPSKAVKMIRQALTGTKQGEKALLTKIQSASRKQADRIRSGTGAAPTRTKLRGREDVWDMDEAAFAKLEQKHS